MTQRYQLILDQAFNTTAGDQIKNVFWYENLGTPASATMLAGLFDADVLPAIAAIMSAAVKINTISVVNLDDPLDYAVLVPTVHTEGSEAGDCLPQFVCWSFRFNRLSRASRNGQKRIAGVPELEQVNGVAAGGFADELAAAAVAMGGHITGLSGEDWVPRICRRPVSPLPLSSSTFFPMIGCQYVRISTQNSRKPGRGA